MKLFVKGQVVFDSKLFSGKVVPSESYCTISDGEVDVFLCKSHKTTNKAEWWPSLFQGDPLMPRLPAMAQSPDLKPPSSFPARRGPSRCGKLCLGVLGLLLALILLLTVTGFALSQSRDLRHQTFAFVWEHMAPLVHANLRPQKEALFSEYRHKLRGRVLELGPGFGANFQHFPKDGSMTWVGIEPNTFMLDGLREAVELSGFPADHAEVVGASAEDFFASVPDNSIDTVVATLVPCSVHDLGRVRIFPAARAHGGAPLHARPPAAGLADAAVGSLRRQLPSQQAHQRAVRQRLSRPLDRHRAQTFRLYFEIEIEIEIGPLN